MNIDARARDEVRGAVMGLNLPLNTMIEYADVLELMVQSWKRGYSAALATPSDGGGT